MKNDETYIEIKESTLCIICLEELDDNIKKICLNCDIKCHNNCLHKWYITKNQRICPICLKTKKYYQQKYRNDKNIIQSTVVEVYTEEDVELVVEEEIVDEEIINYYLQQINQEHSCYYYFIENNCTYKRKVLYFLIMGITLYIYGNY